MKNSDKVLTYEQAKELKWFCKNVTGTRTEFYEALAVVEKFKAKIDRLQQTVDTVEQYFKERPELENPLAPSEGT